MITYNFNNTWGCPGTANAPITVVALAPFACGTAVMDVRDNQVYQTVQIGGQCWFATNLNYGATIPSGLMQRDNCTAEKYCYGDLPANCGTIGGMYQWDELMQYRTNNGAQGFCPPEWHVPTEAEWTTLFNFYISNGFAGSPLKYHRVLGLQRIPGRNTVQQCSVGLQQFCGHVLVLHLACRTESLGARDEYVQSFGLVLSVAQE